MLAIHNHKSYVQEKMKGLLAFPEKIIYIPTNAGNNMQKICRNTYHMEYA
uniref:Uncharacterized protein n=1 Tax=Arundo donax TaxID=35708 RepID=A0A0A9C3N2_ARUDO